VSNIRLFAATLCSFALLPSVVPCAEPKDAPKNEPKDAPTGPSTDPKGVPLELKIIDQSPAAYDIHYYGDPLRVFRQKIVQREKEGRLIRPFSVDMVLEIKNTGGAPLEIWVSGDATLLTLDLKGNEAMTAKEKGPPAKDVVPPTVVKLAPGKAYQFPLTELRYGPRNQETNAYVTNPGIHELTATFITAVSPAPKNAKKILKNGFGEVILKSVPLKFRAMMPT